MKHAPKPYKKAEPSEVARRFARLEMSQVQLCPKCAAQDPWEPICGACRSEIEKGLSE